MTESHPVSPHSLSPLCPYPLDNDGREGGDHLDGLAGTLDPFTTGRLAGLVDTFADRVCLEVGAGSGSVARWLAERVGVRGHVVAIDLKPARIRPHPQLTVLGCDLLTDPLPIDGVDVMHERLTLNHLPPREEILRGMVDALAPNGILLIEEWDTTAGVGGVLHARTAEDAELYSRYAKRRGEIFAAAGTDRGWARRVPSRLIGYGLSDVQTVVHARSWHGGEPGSRHAAATMRQFRDRLLDTGMQHNELARLEDLLDDPGFHVCEHALYSVSGRKPR
jgi:SAM-dependent methyltransferase